MILLLETKTSARQILTKIDIFVNSKLKLILNEKTKYYPSRYGFNFCDYIIKETHIKLCKRCVCKINKKAKKWNIDYQNKQFNHHQFLLKYNSFKVHASYANSYNLI